MKSLHIVLGLLLAAGAATAQQYTISTIAGIGQVQGYFGDTGPATNAQLDFPLRVALDSKGNLYIADYYTYVFAKSPAGTINTIAGVGKSRLFRAMAVRGYRPTFRTCTAWRPIPKATSISPIRITAASVY